MDYPTNFPQDKELSLLKILLKLQAQQKVIKTKQQFIASLQKILKHSQTLQKELNRFPSLWYFRFVLERNYKQFKPEFYKNLKEILIKTQVRSWSGIIPISLFTKGTGCPFNCLYCSNVPNMPKSYFADEPAVMRAIHYDFDPFAQVFGRLQMLYLSGHPIDKIDLIIQGGTFSFYDKQYREWFVKSCYDAVNTSIKNFVRYATFKKSSSKNLSASQKINETAKQRVIGLTIETRPDFINLEEIKFLRKLGVTRVEIGVQAADEAILKQIKRGHGLKEIIEATKLLKETGFKITYHLMPGLPGSNLNKDLQMLIKVFKDEDYKPDNIKFYPTSVVKYSELEKWYEKGKYKPYNEEVLTKLILQFKKKIVPEWVRIQRLVRDLTVNDLVVNTFPSNLRQKIQSSLQKHKIVCPCIRCREIKNQKLISTNFGQLQLKILSYQASGGTEYFLQYVNKTNQIYGLLRLRIPAYLLNQTPAPLNELNNCAIVRELHVYGQALEIKTKNIEKTQHRGLGKKLLIKAEELALKHEAQKLAIISGIGAREYYKKLGFRLVQTYMLKSLA